MVKPIKDSIGELMKYAVLFVPSGEYLYRFSNSKEEYFFSGEEVRKRKIHDIHKNEKFKIAYFRSKKQATEIFTNTFWWNRGGSYIEFNNERISLTNSDTALYFEIVKIEK